MSRIHWEKNSTQSKGISNERCFEGIGMLELMKGGRAKGKRQEANIRQGKSLDMISLIDYIIGI